MVEMVVRVPGVLGPDEAGEVSTVIESECGLEAVIVQIDRIFPRILGKLLRITL